MRLPTARSEGGGGPGAEAGAPAARTVAVCSASRRLKSRSRTLKSSQVVSVSDHSTPMRIIGVVLLKRAWGWILRFLRFFEK